MSQFGGVLFDAPQPSDQLVALSFAVAISTIFAFVAPFAWIPLREFSLFIPFYDSAVVIDDLMTETFFAALFVAHGTSGLLFLAAGYQWTALLALAHFLSFPRLFPGRLPTGPQTTAWLSMAWHIGLPVAVVPYATVASRVIRLQPRALMIAGPAVAVLVMGLIVLSTSGNELLPVIMAGEHERSLANLIAGGICLVAALARRRVLGGRTRLDLYC
jgi:hypothetical protein